MRTLICATIALLLTTASCPAQVSTLGTTAMGIATTPGAIVSSPLTGPSPFSSQFSATTIPGAPATTLASPPLALDPTLPGTSVNCAPTTVELSPSVLSVTSTNTTVSASTTATPAAGTGSSQTLPPAMPVTIVSSFAGSTTGSIAAASVLGSSTPGGSCTSAPGNTLTNAAALPISTPDIPPAVTPGTIQPAVADFDTTDTSISPAAGVMPTPNTTACSESISVNLAYPATMAPANATGATATPGVSPPSGCD